MDMQRDMELIRELLIRIERMPPKAFMVDELRIDGREQPEIRYHVLLLADIGFLDISQDAKLANAFVIRRLTWAGTDFVAAVRSDATWEAVRKRAAGGLDSLSFTVIDAIVSELLNHSSRES